MIVLGPLGVALAAFAVAVVASLLVRVSGDIPRRPATTVSESAPFAGGEAPAVHAWNRYHARY